MKPNAENRLPSYVETKGVKWLLYELFDHLWPWSKQGWLQHKAIQTAGLAFAVAVTVAWALAANGRLGADALIGWWLGWSIYEIVIRLQCKPYIKDGPWWGHRYRPAGRLYGKPIDEYKGACVEGKAFQVTLVHKLCSFHRVRSVYSPFFHIEIVLYANLHSSFIIPHKQPFFK